MLCHSHDIILPCVVAQRVVAPCLAGFPDFENQASDFICASVSVFASIEHAPPAPCFLTGVTIRALTKHFHDLDQSAAKGQCYKTFYDPIFTDFRNKVEGMPLANFSSLVLYSRIRQEPTRVNNLSGAPI